MLGGWPSTDYIGLLAFMKSGGSRIGGNTGQYAMRFMGRDSFILSRDVVARLIAEGVIGAVEEVGVEVPVVVRLEGNNAELGREVLSKSGLNIIAADSLSDAAEKVVAAAGGGK